jgi:GMP synthase-like glutamine amidotransferase
MRLLVFQHIACEHPGHFRHCLRADGLANSDVCAVQAMRIGENAWSLQYHVEVEPDTVTNWGYVPAYQEALQATLGDSGLAAMQAQAAEHMSAFTTNAERLYQNFRHLVWAGDSASEFINREGAGFC